jgi:hypothetical protein
MPDRRQPIQNRIATELTRIAELGAMLKGTVSPVRLKRGHGQRITYLLTYKGQGNKTKSIYVSRDRVKEARRMIDNHRKAKASLDKIVELTVDLFKMKTRA